MTQAALPLQQEICRAYDRQDEALLLVLSKEIDKLQLALLKSPVPLPTHA